MLQGQNFSLELPWQLLLFLMVSVDHFHSLLCLKLIDAFGIGMIRVDSSTLNECVCVGVCMFTIHDGRDSTVT